MGEVGRAQRFVFLCTLLETPQPQTQPRAMLCLRILWLHGSRLCRPAVSKHRALIMFPVLYIYDPTPSLIFALYLYLTHHPQPVSPLPLPLDQHVCPPRSPLHPVHLLVPTALECDRQHCPAQAQLGLEARPRNEDGAAQQANAACGARTSTAAGKKCRR